MDVYIRMYDELKRSEGDNPTIGIVLCSDTDEDIARYSVLHGFASKYYIRMEKMAKEEMLATVLRGELAEQQSIFIMRAFREMRH